MSVNPHITDVFVMHRVLEWEVIELVRHGGMKKWIFLCD